MTADNTTIHVGDYGTLIEVQFLQQDGVSPEDVSGADTYEIWFQKPGDKAFIKQSASLSGDTSVITWTATQGFFDVDGTWTIRGYAAQTGVGAWHSVKENFEVLPQ